MMARLTRAFGALPARQLHLLGGGLLLILAASLWTLALRAPLAQLRSVRAEHVRLDTGGTDPTLLAAQLAQVERETATLSTRLGLGAARPAPAQALVALVADVNRLALAHAVSVTAVTPARDGQTMVFDQVGFAIDATGSYGALLAWMAAIEAEKANLAIVGFDMQPAKAAGQIHTTIRIAAYRPQEGPP
jgi:Tfp pilus assembly protein PilO